MTIDDVERVALGLPEGEREYLVQRLIASLDGAGCFIEAWYDDGGGDAEAPDGDGDGPGWLDRLDPIGIDGDFLL